MIPRPTNGRDEPAWAPREAPIHHEKGPSAQEKPLPPGMEAAGSAGRVGTLPFTETPEIFERQLLLEPGAADPREVRRSAASGHRRGLLLAAFVLLGAAIGLGVIFHLDERKAWQGQVASLGTQLEERTKESAAREDGLRRDGAEKDRLIAERKTESQTLAALVDKALVDLKASLADLRSAREANERLEREYRTALAARRPALIEIIEWLGQRLAEK